MRLRQFTASPHALGLLFVLTLVVPSTARADLILNGTFEAPPILGAGQSGVPIGSSKLIQTDPLGGFYAGAISGISGWLYATPGDNGTSSDHGLARRDAAFGRSADGQSAFINNWDRMMSQTVDLAPGPGATATASIEFGTLGSDTDHGRAGIFYLVAGEADPANLDQFSSRSIILDQVRVANPTWTGFVPDVVVGNQQYVPLTLDYTYGVDDPALGLPVTIAFRTVGGSVGSTFWDNAQLEIQPVPEPGSLLLMATVGVVFARWRRFQRR